MNPTEELINIYYTVIEMVEEAFEDNPVVINILKDLLHTRIEAVRDNDAKIFPLKDESGNHILYNEHELESDIREYLVKNKATGEVVARDCDNDSAFFLTELKPPHRFEHVFYLEDILTMPKSFLDHNGYMLVEGKEV